VQKLGKKVGIYASSYMWGQIMGGSDQCNKFMDLPLWYPHYDNVPNFSDFKPFGGWTKPEIKQYKGDINLCGVIELDLDYSL
jgi:GH25 family lysozyme M1 (1,4-beta-N-acetylmuramidase)